MAICIFNIRYFLLFTTCKMVLSYTMYIHFIRCSYSCNSVEEKSINYFHFQNLIEYFFLLIVFFHYFSIPYQITNQINTTTIAECRLYSLSLTCIRKRKATRGWWVHWILARLTDWVVQAAAK